MKLTIKRDQSDVKGFFGGHKGVSFKIFGQCHISADEKALIERYKVGDYTLAEHTFPGKDSETTFITVNSLVQGTTHQARAISHLLQLEEKLKEGCSNLKAMLTVMSTFGGEEEFEI
jgi:hypothetical protein